MKTWVIQLEQNDDVNSVCNKMSWSKLHRILLVFHPDNKNFTRKYDLLILRRYSVKLGAHLAVVTTSNVVIEYCKTLHIPVFPSTRTAQKSDWGEKSTIQSFLSRKSIIDLGSGRKSFRSNPEDWRSSLGFRILFFSIGLFAVASVLMVFLPCANITINLMTETQSQDISMRASPNYLTGEYPGIIPAYYITASISGSQSSNVTGKIDVPDGYSAGIVQFVNLTESDIVIPPGTVIRTTDVDLVKFLTQEEVIVPAGIGESSDVRVQAAEGGPQGNLPSGALNVVEGGLGASVKVVNNLPLSGGTYRQAPFPTREDRSLLQKSLLENLSKQCESNMIALLSADSIYFTNTLAIKIINEIYLPPENLPGEILSLTMEVECAGLYVSNVDIKNYVVATMNSQLPDGYSSLGDPNIVQSSPISHIDEEVNWSVSAERSVIVDLNPTRTSLLIAGLMPEDASLRLMDIYSLSTPPIIAISPTWWNRIPLVPFQISYDIGGN